MRGPYRVTKVLRSDRYKLKLVSGARGKTTQAAAQYMVPWKGEWCPEACAAFFEIFADHGKLDPGMRGPYKVVDILPSGRYGLKLLAGSYGKTTQAAAQHMVLWRGEWCPESCAAFFASDDDDDTEVDLSRQARHEPDPAMPLLDQDDEPTPGPSRAPEHAEEFPVPGLSMPLLDEDSDD